MSEMKKVPEIRFAGFAEPWEQRKLGEITDMYSGGTPTVGNKEYYNGDIPFIRSGEISSYKTELFITKEGLNNSSAKMIAEGDILYALYGATSGEVSISNLKGAINQAILAIKPHQNYDSQFLMQWLRKSKESIISAYLQGGQGNLSGNIIKHLIIDLPSFDEQRYIGCYFKKIDNLLTLHQRKLDKLVVLKQAMLEKMFPQKGNNVPEVRFAGFTGLWEKRKLMEVVKEITRTAPESNAPIMMISANNGFIEQSERYAFNNAGDSLKKYILLEKGELAYNHGASKLRPYGSCFALTTVENARIPFVYHCFSVEEQNAEFMSIELNGSDVENQLRRIVSSSARMDGLLNISFEEYTSISVLLPKIEEQNRIADYFRNLDHLITLQQRKCESLKHVKAALLQKMFV